MSFTATGCEVSSIGGNLGGKMASFTFCRKVLYQGSSIWSTSNRARCSSGSIPGCLLESERSAMFYATISAKWADTHIWLDAFGGRGVTKTWKYSLPRELSLQLIIKGNPAIEPVRRTVLRPEEDRQHPPVLQDRLRLQPAPDL